jgi:hypothetical protein
MARREFYIFLAVQCAFGCRRSHDLLILPSVTLTDAQVSSAPGDTLAILIYDPSDCFSCGSPLAQWLSWDSLPGHQIRIVLTRKPTQAERTQLLAMRVHFEGVIRNGPRFLTTPKIYITSGGQVVDSAVGYTRQYRLLARRRGDSTAASRR